MFEQDMTYVLVGVCRQRVNNV